MPGSLCCSSGFLDLRPGGEEGTARRARPAGQQGGSGAPGQQSRGGQHWRERGKEAWMLKTAEGRKRGVKQSDAGAVIMKSVAEIPCFAGGRFP